MISACILCVFHCIGCDLVGIGSAVFSLKFLGILNSDYLCAIKMHPKLFHFFLLLYSLCMFESCTHPNLVNSLPMSSYSGGVLSGAFVGDVELYVPSGGHGQGPWGVCRHVSLVGLLQRARCAAAVPAVSPSRA